MSEEPAWEFPPALYVLPSNANTFGESLSAPRRKYVLADEPDPRDEVIRRMPPARISVKPLEWSPFYNGYGLHIETRLAVYSTAQSPLGRYGIGRAHTYAKTTKPKERAFDSHLSHGWWAQTPSNRLLGPFNGDVLAKAAAQADYDARILSAITTQPDPRDEVIKRLMEALEEIAAEPVVGDPAGGYRMDYNVLGRMHIARVALTFAKEQLK